MIPIEMLWFSLLISFGLIGHARGIAKELGVTLPLLVGMYVLLKFGPTIVGLVDRGMRIVGLGGFLGGPSERLIAWSIYAVFMLFIALISYEGMTLDYPGFAAPRPYTGLVDFLSGVANGYLVIGTIWYYLHELGYPIQQIGWFQPPLSGTAQAIVRVLPFNVLPRDTAEWYLLGLILFLIILRVIK